MTIDLHSALQSFISAIAGAAGLASFQFLPKTLHKLFPSKYKYLEGIYSGHWEWTDSSGANPMQTDDKVFFQSPMNGRLIGRGDDPNLGTYTFRGDFNGPIISATYKSDTSNLQPAQSGAFNLSVTNQIPLTLSDEWTGFLGNRIIGTVINKKHLSARQIACHRRLKETALQQ